jgi:hypothetical protein
MLKRSNDSELITINVPEVCIPFYQVWQELVDRRTLDVYQCRVLTALSALKELELVVVKTLSGLFNSDANIEACREETLYILNQDIILEKHHKPVLNRLRSALGKKPSSNAEKNRLLHQIRYILKKMDAFYLVCAIEELKSSILRRDIGEIELFSNIVASQSIHNGWSSHALFDLLRIFRQEDDFDAKWEKFKNELINIDLIEHHVLINIPFPNQGTDEQEIALNSLCRLGLIIETYEQIVKEFAEVTDISTLIKAGKRYFHVTVNAKDIYAASHAAITKISEQLNLASFYNLVSAWDLKSVVIVSINSQSKYHRVFTASELYETHDYIDSSSRIFENTRMIFTDENKLIIRDKLQGSFGYTNISRASLFQEEKYMNLWVALESLARTDMYSDIISNVKETVPAAMSLRYIYRVVRNFIEDCGRCGVKFEFSTCSINMQQDTKQKMVKETINVLKDTGLFSELKEKCKLNSLLYHRVDIIRRLVIDIEFAKCKVENHHKRVNWQIQRLYRIRNEIAHAALREQTSLIVYIEHLYDYLSTYISEIVTALTEKGLISIEDALCSIKDNYDVFIALVNSNDKTIVEDSVLTTGIINIV